jgi:hypothetical protein
MSKMMFQEFQSTFERLFIDAWEESKKSLIPIATTEQKGTAIGETYSAILSIPCDQEITVLAVEQIAEMAKRITRLPFRLGKSPLLFGIGTQLRRFGNWNPILKFEADGFGFHAHVILKDVGVVRCEN